VSFATQKFIFNFANGRILKFDVFRSHQHKITFEYLYRTVYKHVQICSLLVIKPESIGIAILLVSAWAYWTNIPWHYSSSTNCELEFKPICWGIHWNPYSINPDVVAGAWGHCDFTLGLIKGDEGLYSWRGWGKREIRGSNGLRSTSGGIGNRISTIIWNFCNTTIESLYEICYFRRAQL
jgi:hypothetical protein